MKVRIFAALALLLVPALTHANWEGREQRRAFMTQMAKRHGLTQASANTVHKLNVRFGSSLARENVYYTTWPTFLSFAGEARNVALGAAYVDHGAGPHGHIVVGDRVRDSIDPNIDRRFKNGARTRDEWLLHRPWGSRVFALWKAPASSLAKVGIETENAVRNLTWCGMNCVAMVNGHLSREAHVPGTDPSSPFLHLRASGWPHEGAEAVFGAKPDIVIQVLDEGGYETVRANHEHHPLKPWDGAL
jgi:hypothetical protein